MPNIKSIATVLTITTALSGAVQAQTFAGPVVDSSLLADLGNNNACLDKEQINKPVCRPVAAALAAVRPAPATERAVMSVTEIVQLCAAHAIRDVICGEASLLEFKYHREPCWLLNKC